MEYRGIGELNVSVVGLGGNNFGTTFFGAGCDAQDVDRIVNTALDVGINLIDTAEEYSVSTFLGEGSSEQLIGRALRTRRDEVIIASKFSPTSETDPDERGARRITAAVEASLRRLGTDRIDLYQQHLPERRTPLDEILMALDRLVRDGKVRAIGCCNFDARMLDDAASTAEQRDLTPYQSCQVQYSILERPTDDVLDRVARHIMSFLAYFPLASGLLTGKYRRGAPPPADARLAGDGKVSGMLRDGLLAARPPLSDERLETVERLQAFAAARGRSMLELAISWLVCQQSMGSVIAGATLPQQVAANATAAGWALDVDELAEVDAIVASEPAIDM